MSPALGPDTALPPLVITIDGPAGSGKSSTAKAVALRLGFRHLDSGALYRALTLALLRSGVPPETWDDLEPGTLDELDVRLTPSESAFRVLVQGEDPGGEIRSEEVTRLVPRVAQEEEARRKLGELQRTALGHGGLVADGRDMGTVVFPEADLKVFLTASLEERARRRLEQEDRDVGEENLRRELGRIRERDATDSGRKLAPLKKAPGALEIDTTNIAFEAQVQRIVDAAVGLTGESREG